ncbi:hypothetical protein [Stygiolobus caldivivus]|uniref:Uncharacterized protein n=1 Tax=Stygiolobus caldivivus TaxID=2824673 RepID=A0A8D5ZDF0_9CREN|nr:hypothetical protein [Stygiolobus caldivivus]BCU69073.1 hypothetical protein KN1_03700 [Stygiolobus caldivivus]
MKNGKTRDLSNPTLTLFIITALLLLPTSLSATAQISASLSATFIEASQSSISGKNIFYLVINAQGSTSLSGSYTINSISTQLSGYDIPSYSPENGVIVSKPFALNNSVYFIYAAGVTSINPSSPAIKSAYLACVSYQDGVWSNFHNIINSGFTEAFCIYQGYIYAIWYTSITSDTPYLVIITLTGQVVYNKTLPINNVVSVSVLSKDLITIANSTSKLALLQLGSGSISSASLPPEDIFVLNLTAGSIEQVPTYQGLYPTSFDVVNNQTILLVYTSSDYSYLAEYNVENSSVYNVKELQGTATASYYRGLVVVSSIYRSGQAEVTYYNYVFKLKDWSTLYTSSGSTSAPSISLSLAEAIEGTSNLYLFVVKVNGQISSLFPPAYEISSTPSLIYIGGVPQPFTINVQQFHYSGYTVVVLTWAEKVPSTYLVFLNNTFFGSTSDTIYYLNITKNETVLLTVEAQNALGSINESKVISVNVYTSVTHSVTTTSSSPTMTSSSRQPEPTPSPTYTQTYSTNAINETSSSRLTNVSKTESSIIPSSSGIPSSSIYIASLAIIALVAIILIILLRVKK